MSAKIRNRRARRAAEKKRLAALEANKQTKLVAAPCPRPDPLSRIVTKHYQRIERCLELALEPRLQGSRCRLHG